MAEIKKIDSMGSFNSFIMESDSLNVIKLGAPWCGQCKVVEGILQTLQNEDVEGVLLGEINVDDEWFEDIEGMLSIRGIPVLIAFVDGEEKDRLVGLATKDKILEFFGRNK